jgi:hypothetical protein
MISTDASDAIIRGTDLLGHERTVDGDLVDVGTSQSSVLSITVAIKQCRTSVLAFILTSPLVV